MGGLITSIYSWATDRLEFWIMKYLTFASLRWEIYFEKCNQGVIILHLEKLMLLWEEWASSTIGLKMFSSYIHFMIYSFLHRQFFVRSTYCVTNSVKHGHWFCQIYNNFYKLFWNSKLAKSVCFEFQNDCLNLRKSEKISRCILGYLVTKHVDLSKNNLYWLCY